MINNNETTNFWLTKEKDLGEKIIAKSFARLIGKARNGLIEKKGLLYCTADNIYFEDFAKSTMYDFILPQNTNYEKFSMQFQISDISHMLKVSEPSAIACCQNKRTKAKPISTIQRFFTSTAWEIQFNSDISYFFELLNPNGFIEVINKA
ncbi:MAG: hypothetical protein BKP49_10985 [Treponema sp. CETP13]|nr:MAG: hypothetical protein BKP49_10985 [Treponema sp. CETP13]